MDILRSAWDAEHRNEALLALGLLVAIWLFPKPMGPGIVGLGLVSGASFALHAIGMVLVYRSTRVINFAQVQLGLVTANLFALAVQFTPLFRAVEFVCPPCLGAPSTTQYWVNYWLCLALTIPLAIGVGHGVSVSIVRRFAHAPRLVLTIATIFLAQALPALTNLVGTVLVDDDDSQIVSVGQAVLPFDLTVEIRPAIFHITDILTVAFAVAAAALVWWLLTRTRTGVAIRAVSDDPARAETLGVPTAQVTSRVWVVATLLSTVAGLLSIMSPVAGTSGDALGLQTTLLILVVAVLARMSSLPFTILAALLVGVLRQAVLWNQGSTEPLQIAFPVLLGVALMLQRHRSVREQDLASGWQSVREARPIPRELAGLDVILTIRRSLTIVAVILVAGLPFVLPPGQVNLAAVTMLYAIVGLSILLLTGWAGQISLGQFAFAGIGAAVTAATGWPFLPAIVAGVVAGAAAAILVGLPALKLRGLHLAIMTLAFAGSVSLLLAPSRLGRSLPASVSRPSVFGISLDDERAFYFIALSALGAMVFVVLGLRRSHTGRILITTRDNERLAQAHGVNLMAARLTAFGLSGAMSAFAGGLFLYHQRGFDVSSYEPRQSVVLFLMTVIGGLGSVAGPVLGALYQGSLSMLGSNVIVSTLATGLGGLALLLVVPGGLAKLVFDVRDLLLRRIASRRRIEVASLTADGRAVEGDGRITLPPRQRAGSTAVAGRYELTDQWTLDLADKIVLPGTVGHERARTAAFGVAAGRSGTGDGT